MASFSFSMRLRSSARSRSTCCGEGVLGWWVQRAKQQIQQNRFVIIGAGALVIALLIFVSTSMPHRGAPQKVKSRSAAASEDLALESGTASNDKSLFPITDSGRPVTKEVHEGFLNERDLQRTATKPAAARTREL
jgi:hypothetical protein